MRRRKVGNTSGPTNPPDSLSGTWYCTLDLPLDNFLRCLLEGDITALIISGQPSARALLSAWETINELFLDAMKDKEGLYKTRLLNRINLLKFNIDLIGLCLTFLRKAHAQSVEQVLVSLIRLDAPLDPSDKVVYLRLLQTAENRSKRMEIDLEELQAEYALMKGKDDTAAKASILSFDRLIAQVSYFMKFRINRKTIPTGDFAAYYTMMREHHDFLKAQSKRRT